MTSKQLEYDYYRDGELVMSGTVKQIAQQVGRSPSTVVLWRYKPPKGVRVVRKEETLSEGGEQMVQVSSEVGRLDWNPDMAREVRLHASIGNSDKLRTIEIEACLFYDELKELVCWLTLGGEKGAGE